VIFVRHGRAILQRDLPTHEWRLDPKFHGDIEALKALLPTVPVVCSTMRRAIDTAQFFGEPTVDSRLDEVSRPWTDDLDGDLTRYFVGETLDGWEPQAEACARFRAVVDEHGHAIYVSHGTLLSLYLASLVTLDALPFWANLQNPDAWQVEGSRLRRLG
jgi:broad specificity phosphatase PhoE